LRAHDLAHLGTNHAADDVGWPAGREADQNANRLVRIGGLRQRNNRRDGENRNRQSQMHFLQHRFSPVSTLLFAEIYPASFRGAPKARTRNPYPAVYLVGTGVMDSGSPLRGVRNDAERAFVLKNPWHRSLRPPAPFSRREIPP